MYDQQQFQPGKATAPSSQVEISVSCKGLKNRDVTSKSDPMCVLFIKEFSSPNFVEVGRTEVIKNCLDPEFSHKFVVDYRFEESQKLKLEMYDVDSRSANLKQQDFLGRLECTLGEIVGAAGSKIHKNLTGLQGKLGNIIVSAEELGTSKEVLTMQWKGDKLDKKDFMRKSDPFIQIYRTQDDGRPIRFDVYDWDDDGGQASHDLIGSCQSSISTLLQQGSATLRVFELINPQKKAKKKDYKNSGTLHLVSLAVETEHSFLDYVRGGTQINFTVAIDFTASNGNPNDPNSLHYIHPHAPNAYMVALKSVGEICQDYDTDKMFPALGFGAKLPPNGVVSHEFFLNFNPNDPYCHRIEGVMEAYKRSLMSVQLYGPTNFAPVINHVARIAGGSKDGSNYFVLLIITDGAISDMDNTMAAIVNASHLPMSIIIVGVGNADFGAMDILDADKGSLNFQGRRAQRDIVQFVPMRNYLTGAVGANVELSQARLAKDVLAEVPQQFVSYMRLHQINPKLPVQIANPQLTPSNVDTLPPNSNAMPPANVPPAQHGANFPQNPGAPAPVGPGYPQQGAPYQQQPGPPSAGYPQTGAPYQQGGGNYPAPGAPYQQQPPAPYQQQQPGAQQQPGGSYPQQSAPGGYPPAAGYPTAPGNVPNAPQGAQAPYPSGGATPGYPAAYPQQTSGGYPQHNVQQQPGHGQYP